MKILTRALWCAFLLLAPALSYGQMTQITATGLKIGSNLITTGTVCAIAVDVNENPISVSISGGGLQGVGQACALISGGAIATATDGGAYTLPEEALSQPAGFNYTFTITDTTVGSLTKGQSFQLRRVPSVTGSTYALDRYFPTTSVPTASTFSFTTGSGAPTSACSGKAFYQDLSTPAAPVLYQCGGDNLFHVITGSGGGSTTPATASAFGAVKLATGQSSTTLSKVATTGVYSIRY